MGRGGGASFFDQSALEAHTKIWDELFLSPKGFLWDFILGDLFIGQMFAVIVASRGWIKSGKFARSILVLAIFLNLFFSSEISIYVYPNELFVEYNN